MMIYDHRIGIAVLALLGLPFALTFILIALVGLTTAFLLLGHVGTILSHALRVVLPIPALTSYLDSISSPYSLLVATILAAAIGGAWIYLAVRFNTTLFRLDMPALWSPKTVKEVATEDLHHDSDDRTVLHHSPPNNNLVLDEEHNPYIRSVSRSSDHEHYYGPASQRGLRPDASEFRFKPPPLSPELSGQPRQQNLRPTATAFEYRDAVPLPPYDAINKRERVPRSMPWVSADRKYDGFPSRTGWREEYLEPRRP